MPAPLLYTYRRCPYAMRARMALLIAGQAFDAYEVVLRDMPAALRALSAKATVPVLQLADGGVIDQSWTIMRWALARDELDAWWQPAQSAENLQLLACNDGLFKHHLDGYKYPSRHGCGEPREALQMHRTQALSAMLLPLNARLQSSRFLGGERPCATDLAVFPFVRQFAAVEPAWFAAQPWPALHAWLADWRASAVFAACMVKLQNQARAPFPLLPTQQAL